MNTIHSIGYGNRKIDDFLLLLKQNNIDVLIDIRSKPQSRFQPYYNKAKLEIRLAEEGIKYIFMGAELGAKPKEEKFYVEGKVSYDKLKETSEYKEGLQRLINLSKQGIRACIMCCELKAEGCHRKELVGESLFANGILTNHINEKGELSVHCCNAELKLF
jgi:uncharacterized protein (DUF488 family)